jgi:rubrerythrin
VTATDGLAPAKAVRLLGMLNHGLDEMHRVTLDDSARRSLIASHRAALIEVASTLSDALIDELIALRFAPLEWDATVDEIRVAQAQLLGWVNGLILAEAIFATARVADGEGARPLPVASGATAVRTRDVRPWPGAAGRGKLNVEAREEVQCQPRTSEASAWEQELFDHFRSHIDNEEELIAAYGELAESTAAPGFGYLARLIVADERRHHELFSNLAETIQAEAEFRPHDSAVPSLPVARLPDDERERILGLTERFLAIERQDARDLERLAKKLEPVKDTTLCHLLVRLMRADSDKHIRILRFIRDHARHGAG